MTVQQTQLEKVFGTFEWLPLSTFFLYYDWVLLHPHDLYTPILFYCDDAPTWVSLIFKRFRLGIRVWAPHRRILGSARLPRPPACGRGSGACPGDRQRGESVSPGTEHGGVNRRKKKKTSVSTNPRCVHWLTTVSLCWSSWTDSTGNSLPVIDNKFTLKLPFQAAVIGLKLTGF